MPLFKGHLLKNRETKLFIMKNLNYRPIGIKTTLSISDVFDKCIAKKCSELGYIKFTLKFEVTTILIRSTIVYNTNNC